jgi:iron(III) transport system ATP-binding protein
MIAALRLQDVSKSYASTRAADRAVDGVDLTVSAGSFVTLLGPSGCGKSTTLRMIAGLERPDSGRIEGRGGLTLYSSADGIDVPARERGIGMVFQSLALWPHLTVAENVAYPLRMLRHARTDITSRVDELIRLMELDGLGDRRPSTLSGGQQQRVAIARALAGDPHLLLLDEPFSALDAHLRHELGRALKDIQSRLQMTVIYVTHDRQEALRLSDEVAVMHSGRLLQTAPPAVLYQRPASTRAATLLGDANILRGHVVATGPGDLRTVATSIGDISVIDATGTSTIGEDVDVCIRPENVTIDPLRTDDGLAIAPSATNASAEPVNEWRGAVSRLEFRGPWSRAEIEVSGATLNAKVAGHHGLFLGTTVSVEAAAEHCWVMQAASDPADTA